MQTESIQSKGGKARVAALTKQELSESGKKAALARWGNRPIRAIHRGNFQKDFGINVACYVLNDPQKTAVVSQRGLARALGFPPSNSGTALPKFLATKTMSGLLGSEFKQKFAQPVVFEWSRPGFEQPPGSINGFNVTLLIDICQAVVQAEANGSLGKRNDSLAEQAHIILGASAKAGIKGLVYALAGYSPTADEVIAAFKMYVLDEAKKYEKEFPPELYKAWYRLYQIPPIKGRGRPWHFKKLTVDHIYVPLANSNGKILDLMRAEKANDGDRKKKLLQFLSEVGTRALRMHLGRVVEMAEDAENKEAYERKIVKRFGGQSLLDFSVPPPPTEEE